MRLDFGQLASVSKILEHLSYTDDANSEVQVFEGEVGLANRNGEQIGKAVWNSDVELWFFQARPEEA